MTTARTEETTPAHVAGPDPSGPDDAPATPLVTADLLVEDVSIDGMCGVY